MDDLVQWLGEQLDEDERIARAACWDERSDVWTARPPQENYERYTVVDYCGDGVVAVTPENADADGVGRHVAEHDPARVLRDIDAKRQLVARGGPFCTSGCDEPGNEPMNPDTNWVTSLEHHLDCGAYEAAKLLAVPYADRPGYREEWRP